MHKSKTSQQVIIVGAGFGGLAAAKNLANLPDIEVTLLDRHNYHLFQPLLYQVAMAGLSPGDIASPIRTIFAKARNIRVLMGEVKSVSLAEQNITTDFGTINYDYLILACGAHHSYFGHEEWEPFAPGLKTLEQATEVRRRVLTAFELAEREPDALLRDALLTFVIVGGGPTGVELAGALGEINSIAFSKDYRRIDPSRTRILLIEAGPRILASFDESLAAKAAKDLQSLGVTIWTSTRVIDLKDRLLTITGDHNEILATSTVIWAAGVKPSALNAALNKNAAVPLDSGGRVQVQDDLSLAGHAEVFVIGDQACFYQDDKPLPGLAPVALQQGRAAADNIIATIRGRARRPFRYLDKGQLATIGRKHAILQAGRLRLSGHIAWYAWLVVHIYYLIGFKNRVLVLIQWAWSYFNYKRGAQLITNREWRSFGNSELLLQTRVQGDADQANPPNQQNPK